MVALLPRLIVIPLVAVTASATGLLVHLDGNKVQFVDAFKLEVNGKDKALVLGSQTTPAAAVNKLPSLRLVVTVVRDAGSGVLAAYAKGSPVRYLYPDGIPKNAAPPPADAWVQARITFQRTPSDKAPAAVPFNRFVAYLAGGVEELASICMDPDALKLIGGTRAFEAQIQLTAAAVAAYASDPSMAAVERQVAGAMRLRLNRFERGIDSAASLDEGLRFAQLSAQAYPALAEHERYRTRLAESKRWLDRRAAVLSAFAAGQQWDAFLLAYRDFEIHQASFPILAKTHLQALNASLDAHREQGKQRLERGHYRRAFEHLRLASLRRPSDSALQKDLAIAWTEYSRQTATAARQSRPSLSAGQRDAIAQSLHFAARYREQNKLDEAMKSVAEAERIDPTALPVLLAKAGILGARNEIAAALETLDRFDMHAVDEERAAGSKLRNELLFQMTAGLDELGKKSEAAWSAGRYHESLRWARQALMANPDVPGLLYRAGSAALVTRDRQLGTDLLKRYLHASNTLDASPARRSDVYSLLAGLDEPDAAAAAGDPNWFSGMKLPAEALYCPASLAFQSKVDHIEASNKLTLRYQWEGDRLRSIVPAFDKSVKPTGEKPIVFTYHPQSPHAVAVDQGSTPRTLPSDPDQLLQSFNVVLPNTPLADPAMTARLAGRGITLTVSGNRFFHPFVWERPLVFAVEYDSQGRARRARQLPETGPSARPPVVAEFSWDGLRLTSIRVHQPVEGVAAPPLIYERILRYDQGRLAGEEIKAGSKTSSIKYKWNGGQLVSAECEKDETLDGRSRDVFFVTAARARKD